MYGNERQIRQRRIHTRPMRMTEKAESRFCFPLESLDAVWTDEGGVDGSVGVGAALRQEVVQMRARHCWL